MAGQITTKLLSILADLGIDRPLEQTRKQKEITRPLPRQSYYGVNAIGDIDMTSKHTVPSTVAFLKNRRIADRTESSSKICLMIFFVKLYIVIANSYGLFLPSFLDITQKPFLFWLLNIALLILAMILSIDILVDGIHRLPLSNINSLITISSFVCLAQLISVITMQEAVGYLPFSLIVVFQLHFALKSLSADTRNISLMYKLESMDSESATITNSKNGKDGFIHKEKQSGKLYLDNKTSIAEFIYFYFVLIFITAFSLYAGKLELGRVLWIMSAMYCVAIPLNFIYVVPKKRLTKALFREGISIPKFSDVTMFKSNRTICVTDNDLFPKGSIQIKALKLYSHYSMEDILNLGYMGFSLIDSPTKYAFEERLLYVNHNLVCELGTNTKNGFTFMYSGKKISIGSASYVLSLGLSAIEGSKARYPMYFVIDNAIAGVIDLEFIASPNVYDLLEVIEKEKIEIMLSTVDFNIKPDIVRKTFNLFDIFSPEFDKRCTLRESKYYNKKPVRIKKVTGYTYLLSVMYSKRISKIIKRNVALGVISSICGGTFVCYLSLIFRPELMLPQNILMLLFVWFVPSIFTMLATYKV